MTAQIERYVPADVTAAIEHLRTYVAQYAGGSWRMERVVLVAGRGRVPHSELAMQCRIAGKEIYAAAIVYADYKADGPEGPAPTLTAAYAYVLTLDGEFGDGLPGEVVSYDCREAAGDTVRRHDPFEWLDRRWYITKTGWKKTPRDYRDVKDGQKRVLVNGGGRGTMLVPITLLDDGEHPPRVERPEVRTK